MKTYKTHCFDFDIAEELGKESNASALINKLLKEHFASRKPKTREERDRHLAEMKIQLEAIEKIEALDK